MEDNRIIYKSEMFIDQNFLKKLNKKGLRNTKIVIVSIGAAATIFTVIMLIFGIVNSISDISIRFINVGISAVLILFGLLYPGLFISAQYAAIVKRQLDGRRTIEFGIDEIRVNPLRLMKVIKHKYSEYTSVIEDDNFYYLKSGKTMLSIEKGSFTEGNEEGFGKFIKSKIENK